MVIFIIGIESPYENKVYHLYTISPIYYKAWAGLTFILFNSDIPLLFIYKKKTNRLLFLDNIKNWYPIGLLQDLFFSLSKVHRVIFE